jgi:hypothetical protein
MKMALLSFIFFFLPHHLVLGNLFIFYFYLIGRLLIIQLFPKEVKEIVGAHGDD